jgi:outer membrane protein OmpA-like peptidoglycan-associated protein
MKRNSLILIAILGLVGCTSYPEHGQGGMAESYYSGGFTPVMPDQPLGPQHGLRFDWTLAKLHLDMLVREGAELCFPAAVLQSRLRQDRIARELEAGLHRDAANDLIVQRKRLSELENNLTYVTAQAECLTSPYAAASVQSTDNVELIYSLLNADNQFAIDSSAINPKYMGRLAEATGLLTQNPQFSVVITGHADSTGSESKNDQLALERAQQVERYLTIFGLEKGRATVASNGSRNPLFDGESAEVRLTNRRVSVEVIVNSEVKGAIK